MVYALGILAIIICWIAYMPVQPYQPFCERFDDHHWIEEFSPRLSELYRGRLTGYLHNTGTPYFEIGDIVLVPFVDNAPDYNEGPFPWRLLHILLASRDFIWGQTNKKIFLWSTRQYMNLHPDSEFAKRSSLYSDLIFRRAHGPRMYVDHYELKCDLIKKIADPSFNDAKRD